MVLWSTLETREKGVVSALAVAETIFFSVVFWILMLRFGLTWKHLVFLFATPLVLMRSKQSITLAVRWFEAFFDYSMEEADKLTSQNVMMCNILMFAVISIYGGVTAAFLPFRFDFNNPLLIAYLSASLTAALFGAMLGSRSINFVFYLSKVRWMDAIGKAADSVAKDAFGTSASYLFAALFILPGAAVGIWLRALGTRMLATLRHPIYGAKALPQNWRQATMVADSFQHPELVPDHTATGYGDRISFSRMKRDGQRKELRTFLFGFVLSLIVFTPAYVWRWAIKSTAWFYLPYLITGRGWQRLDDKELLAWAKSYCGTKWNVIGLGYAFVVLLVSLASLLSPERIGSLWERLDAAGAPMTPLAYLFVVDWGRFLEQPWLWCYVPGWIVTVALFFSVDGIVKRIAAAGDTPSRLPTLRFWMWASNVRFLLTNLGLLVTLLYVASAFDLWGQAQAMLDPLWSAVFSSAPLL